MCSLSVMCSITSPRRNSRSIEACKKKNPPRLSTFPCHPTSRFDFRSLYLQGRLPVASPLGSRRDVGSHLRKFQFFDSLRQSIPSRQKCDEAILERGTILNSKYIVKHGNPFNIRSCITSLVPSRSSYDMSLRALFGLRARCKLTSSAAVALIVGIIMC